MRRGRWLGALCAILAVECGGSVEDTTGSSPTDNDGSAGSSSGGGDGGAVSSDGGVVTADDGGGCDRGLTRCGDVCVDRLTDVEHCGACSFRCYAGQRCAMGECDWGAGLSPGPCLPNEVDCPAFGCVDLDTNVFSCGLCSNVCRQGDICVGGACQIPDCVAPETYCTGFGCVDLGENQDNCGHCGFYCGPFEQCINRRCEPPTCAQNETYCYDSGCVDLSSSADNCGSCDALCPEYYECVQSRCMRPSCGQGETFCEDWGCVDLSSNVDTCGNCDDWCEGNAFCENGSCVCPAPNVACGRYCTDTQADAANCGTCGHACGRDPYTCVDGRCLCSGDERPCGDFCASRFWYCPPSGYGGDPSTLCRELADNDAERCACDHCANQLAACSADDSCIFEVDCALDSLCWPTCSAPLSFCRNVTIDPATLYGALLSCINTWCIGQ